MNITLNGEPKQTDAKTISTLLAEISAPATGVAVEVNREIVPKSLHNNTEIKENDIVEIVSFIGGG